MVFIDDFFIIILLQGLIRIFPPKQKKLFLSAFIVLISPNFLRIMILKNNTTNNLIYNTQD